MFVCDLVTIATFIEALTYSTVVILHFTKSKPLCFVCPPSCGPNMRVPGILYCCNSDLGDLQSFSVQNSFLHKTKRNYILCARSYRTKGICYINIPQILSVLLQVSSVFILVKTFRGKSKSLNTGSDEPIRILNKIQAGKFL